MQTNIIYQIATQTLGKKEENAATFSPKHAFSLHSIIATRSTQSVSVSICLGANV